MEKILVFTNSDIGLYKFRRELLEELVKLEYEVYISLPKGDFVKNLTDIGCNYIETPIDRRGKNIFSELRLLLSYKKILKQVNPSVVLTYTIKPNIYGGIVCRLKNIPYISNITGLGTTIENKGIMQKISSILYKIGLKEARCVFFQNIDNHAYFSDKKILNGKYRLIPGSGVNLNDYSYQEYPTNTDYIKFLFIGRIMKDKGINELLSAAEKIKLLYSNVQFDIIGDIEEDYKDMIQDYVNNGIINYHGQQKDVRNFIKDSHAIILPSYHEGIANVLLESASSGRPILASNVSGCRETFDEGLSGLGFEVKNVDKLVETIIKFIELSNETKKAMGVAGRHKIENEFNRGIIVNAYIEEINSSINS